MTTIQDHARVERRRQSREAWWKAAVGVFIAACFVGYAGAPVLIVSGLGIASVVLFYVGLSR